MFRAVGVRDEERALAVVAAAGAHRFAFLLPRLVTESSAPFAGVLTGPACLAQLLYVVGGRTFTRCSRVVAQSCAFWGLTEHLLNWQCAVHCDTTTGKVAFFARVMDAVRLFGDLCFVVCAVLAAL